MSFRRAFFAIVCTATTLCGLAVRPAFGQESASPLAQPEYHWFVTASVGTTSSGPANDIEKAMVGSGFNRSSPGIDGNIPHPFSRTGIGETGFPWMIAVHSAVRPHLLLGVTVGNAPIGLTDGYHDPHLSLYLRYSVSTISPTISVRFADAIHLGIGPALYFAKTWQDRPGGAVAKSQSITKVGALVDLGVSTSPHSRFFAIFSLQYRYVGKATIGPFETSSGQNAATLPASTVSFNHVFYSFGAGLRL